MTPENTKKIETKERWFRGVHGIMLTAGMILAMIGQWASGGAEWLMELRAKTVSDNVVAELSKSDLGRIQSIDSLFSIHISAQTEALYLLAERQLEVINSMAAIDTSIIALRDQNRALRQEVSEVRQIAIFNSNNISEEVRSQTNLLLEEFYKDSLKAEIEREKLRTDLITRMNTLRGLNQEEIDKIGDVLYELDVREWKMGRRKFKQKDPRKKTR